MNQGLPKFIIIGAVKGATTWIHNQLQHNPAVYLPSPEPHFFSQDFELGFEHYRSLFVGAKPGQMLGEKSADYFAHPLAAARMAATLPDRRLVVQLRNPVDRAYSDYKMLYRRGTVTAPPETYLADPVNAQPRFLEDGLYAKHLKRWLQHFDREQIEVIFFEDVKSAPRDVVGTVCRHIGAPYYFSTEVGTKPRNDSSKQFLPLPVRAALAPLKQAVRPLRGKPVFEGVRRVFAKEISYPELPAALRDRMIDFYADDVAELERLTDRDLGHWKKSARLAA